MTWILNATRVFWWALGLLSCFSFFVAEVHADDIIKGKYGAWTLRCDATAKGVPEQCGLTQTLRSEDNPSTGVFVVIRKTKQVKNGLLQIVTPLNAILPEGVRFRTDQTEFVQLPFFKCSTGGCLAETIIDDDLFERLKKGHVAVITIYLNPGEGLRHLLQLEGFAEGYAALH